MNVFLALKGYRRMNAPKQNEIADIIAIIPGIRTNVVGVVKYLTRSKINE